MSLNQYKIQKNVPPKTRQEIELQSSQFLPNAQIIASTIQDQHSVVAVEEVQKQDFTDILSDITESITKEELKLLISYLKQRQPILNITLPNLEKKQKMYQLSTQKLQRQQFLAKYPTTEQLLRQKQLQELEDLYDNMNILGDSILEYNFKEYNHFRNLPRKKRENLTLNQQMEREQLRQRQIFEQEDVYGSMSILGESVLEYDLTEVPYITHNKPRKQPHKKQEVLTSDQKMEREQLRQIQIQEQEDFHGSINILGDSILEYDLAEIPYSTHNKQRKQPHTKTVLTPEQKMEREQLRQKQLQDQEDLYEQMDLLGEAVLEFTPLHRNISSHKNIGHAHTIISIPPEEAIPQTSSGPRRTSKYLSPEQVAQLAKIRKKRYEQQEREYLGEHLYGEPELNVLKDKYSFRQQNALLKSPRELVFRKSIVNLKKGKHSKSLAMPVMNFPPTNWPTPIIPEIRQDLDNLRQEQRKYFLSMQQAQSQQKSQNQVTAPKQNLSSTQNQKQNSRQDQNKYQRNMIDYDDEVNVALKKDRHKFLRCVYIILCVQWSLITGIVSLFKYHKPSSRWLKSSREWTWLHVLCTLILVIITFAVFPVTRNIFPINLMMLTLFTLLVAFMFSFVEIYYPNDAVLFSLTCTCAICIVLTIFFCQTTCSFTIYSGLSLCITIILLVLVIIYLFIEVIILQIFCATIGVALYSVYLVYDTRTILTEKSKFQIEPNNYVLGAIHLNLDFIFIIVAELQC